MDFDYSYLDYAFINGSVITVNQDDDIAEAVGVKGNKIVFVGTTKGIETIIDDKTQVVDLKGRTLMPGINDTHYHPILNGLIGGDLNSGIIDIGPKYCKSIPDILNRLKEATEIIPKGHWVSMMGYEAASLAEKRHPTLEELNEVAPNHPVHCNTKNGHIAMYNSLALEYIGVLEATDASKFPPDEVEVIDGRLTGLVRGHTSFYLWGQVDYPEEKQVAAALKSHKQCLEHGITSLGDMGEAGPSSYGVMQKLSRDQKFRVRNNMAIHSIFGKPYSLTENENWLATGFVTGLGDEHFRVGPCKFMIDGGSGGPSCATREPYSHDPNLPREQGWERKETWDYIKLINDAGCQCTAHAIGDLAVEYMIEGYERCYAQDPEKVKKLRHRIEHCTLVDKELIDKMAMMNICPSVNAGLTIVNGKNLAKFFGPERVKYFGALKSMMEAGVMCSLHSDAPSGPIAMEMIDGAVNRYDRVNDYEFDQTQAVSVLEAIRCCTYNAAYSSFEENIKGSLELGKLADLIILSDDILKINSRDIHKLKIDLTMIDGRVEYERKN